VTFIAFPFHLGDHGRTATASSDEHIAQMIEQVLFTRPGERVNRPDFGAGLLDVVFAPNSPQGAAAAQLTISASLQRWLGDLISVQSVQVSAELSTLQVQISYTVTATGTPGSATFALGGPP
jgi:phage baseplate assembly protein W